MQTSWDATRHRLVFVYWVAKELHRKQKYDDPSNVSTDSQFLERISIDFEEVISDTDEITDAWGHTIKIEWVKIPESDLEDFNIKSAGENGIWGDDDDQSYPGWDRE